MERKNIMTNLLEIQRELKVEKTHWNDFGGYYSRSKEDILEAVKPLAHERGCVVVMDDEITPVADGWVYVKSTASLVDTETGESMSASSAAREPEAKKKLDSSQITGSAASYAGKRALGNLFAIDDTADGDSAPGFDQAPASGPFIAACTACGQQYQFEDASQLDTSACMCGNRQFKAV